MSDYDSVYSDSDMEIDEDAWGDIDIDTIQAIEQNLMENDPDATSDDVISAINMIINLQTEDVVTVSSIAINV
jgi:hypothetical protein